MSENLNFLQNNGKNHPSLKGLDYSLHELDEYRRGAETILYMNFGNDGLQFLKRNDIVFLSSQGCNFLYFQSIENENPPIYLIRDNMNKLERIKLNNSFTNWLN